MRSEDQFKLTPELLKNAITEKTKLLVLPFPNNPTGAIMEREDLEAIATVLRDTKILVISDEIYGELNYTDTRHVSITELRNACVCRIFCPAFFQSLYGGVSDMPGRRKVRFSDTERYYMIHRCCNIE